MDLPEEWINYQLQYDLSAEYFQDIPENSHKQCVIIEYRCHERLIIVIKNFMYLLQKKEWGLTIFHSKSNAEFIMNGLVGWPNVQFVLLDTDPIFSGDYSSVLCKPDIWRMLLQAGCINALVFNVDTVLLKDEVDQFIEYDYIGAPWCIKFLGVLTVGNGGLSLRNCKTMLAIIQTHPIPKHPLNEDIYFSYFLLQTPNVNIPTMDIAKRFSVETIYNEDTCGMHKPHLDKFPNRDAFIDLLSVRYV